MARGLDPSASKGPAAVARLALGPAQFAGCRMEEGNLDTFTQGCWAVECLVHCCLRGPTSAEHRDTESPMDLHFTQKS